MALAVPLAPTAPLTWNQVAQCLAQVELVLAATPALNSIRIRLSVEVNPGVVQQVEFWVI